MLHPDPIPVPKEGAGWAGGRGPIFCAPACLPIQGLGLTWQLNESGSAIEAQGWRKPLTVPTLSGSP